MSLLEALLLGLIQGVTEFFPVSSSSHLKIAKILLEVPLTESGVLFDLASHLGTVCALLIYFRKELLALLLKPRTITPYIIASLPLLPIYFFLKPLRAACAAPSYLGFFLILTSLILFCGHFWGEQKRKKSAQGIGDTLIIGTMQGLALFPGISRSGATISAARVLGWDSKTSVIFSFILSIPAVAGGLALESFHLYRIGAVNFAENLTPCLIGFFTSFIIGLMVLGIAITLLSKKGWLKPFAWYCLLLGLCVAIWLNVT